MPEEYGQLCCTSSLSSNNNNNKDNNNIDDDDDNNNSNSNNNNSDDNNNNNKNNNYNNNTNDISNSQSYLGFSYFNNNNPRASQTIQAIPLGITTSSLTNNENIYGETYNHYDDNDINFLAEKTDSD